MNESNSDTTIKDIRIVTTKFPLTKPYNLSFTILYHFISIQTLVSFSDGRETTAEVVPLLGYNDESEDIIIKNLTDWTKKIVGLPINDARTYIQKNIKSFPFSTTALLTAIDLYKFPIQELNHDALQYVIPTSTVKIEELKELLTNPNHTIKVKLTGNVQKDIFGLEQVRNELESYSKKIRFDANQAYTVEDTESLCEYLSINQYGNIVEYIEQPLPVGMENELGYLREKYNTINFMLDESIVKKGDLDLAIKNDILFIKLKLFKQGGINEVISIAELAHKKNIRVILGNGVATRISNYIENQIYNYHDHLFEYPLESNGFKKLRRQLNPILKVK